MEIQILVEPVSGNGFRASSGQLLGLQIEAPTRSGAIEALRQLIEKRMREGMEVVTLQMEPSQHPLAPYAGMLKDDPQLPLWKRAIELAGSDASGKFTTEDTECTEKKELRSV